MCKCVNCGREYSYDKKAGHTKELCNSCSVNKRRIKYKEKCIDYKGGCCSICGYNKCNRALEFHHIDDSSKSFGISGSYFRPWDLIKKELDKCVIVCSNCHAEIHDGV